MSQLLRPATEWELQSIIAAMVEKREPVEVVGVGSKRNVGRPMQVSAALSTSSMRGITLYAPNELVMSVRAGTPLAQVEAELGANGQMLAFEPIDLGPAIGSPRGVQTIGSIFATNYSGSRRISTGSARDHLLGIRAVNGRAELFHSGGRVMKNVTGYDLARGLSGSWGTLAVIAEATFKVMPWPEASATLIYKDLPDDIAGEVMCSCMQLPYEISGAVHLPAGIAGRLEHEELRALNTSLTAFRIENFANSVPYRLGAIKDALRVYGEPEELDSTETVKFWEELRRLSVMPFAETCLWRISTSPTRGPKIVAAIKRHMTVNAFYDWSGGLLWVEVPASADAGASDIRRAVAVNGGHATLIRANPDVRAAVEVFQPQAPILERLARGLKEQFDPYGILNPGRMYAAM